MSFENAARGVWERLRAEAQRAPRLDAEEERALVAAAQAGDVAAMSRLCASHLRLVVQVAAGYRRPWVSDDDLVSEGAVGLVEAVKRFDLAVSTRLSTYAAWWIRARIREFEFTSRTLLKLPSSRGVRRARAQLSNVRRVLSQRLGREATLAELGAELGISESELACVATSYAARHAGPPATDEPWFDPPDPRPSPEKDVAEQEARAFVDERVASARARMRVRDRLIFDAHLAADKPLVELASELGVTRQRVCQIVHRLRDGLEQDLRAAVC